LSSTGTFDPEHLIVERLEGLITELGERLASHDLSGAFSAIERINTIKEESIFYCLGVLARGLHTAIVSFRVDDHGKHYLAHDEEAGGAAGVTSQLENVLRMSEDSARKTLNILESSMPLVRDLRQRAEQSAGTDAAAALAAQSEGLAALEHNLMEILMAQGFQDLAGQAIRKVNGILGAMQADLLALLTYANQVKSLSEPVRVPVPGELAQTRAEDTGASDGQSRDPAMSQDSVDDLLASLGF
jgi:chemotaxis protein CheZ